MSARDEERQHLNGWLGRCLPRPGRRPAAVPAYQEALAQGKLPRLSGFARALASRPADRVPSAARRRFQGGDLPGASRPAAFRKSSPGPPRARHGGHHGRRRDQAVARRLLDGRRGRAGGPWPARHVKAKWGLKAPARPGTGRAHRTSAWLLAERTVSTAPGCSGGRSGTSIDARAAAGERSPSTRRGRAPRSSPVRGSRRASSDPTLAPDDAGLYEELAGLFIEGDLPSARHTSRRPAFWRRVGSLLQRMVRLQVLAGDYAAAELAVFGSVSAGLRLFWTAYIACRWPLRCGARSLPGVPAEAGPDGLGGKASHTP